MIDEVKKKYQKAFEQYGDDNRSVFFPKGRQFVRYNALIPFDVPPTASILDFGCGLGKMKEWLEAEKLSSIKYTGADIVPEFIAANKIKFPDANFIHISSSADLDQSWDIVSASGVFSMLYTEDLDKHRKYVFSTLDSLFHQNTNLLLSFDFMHSEVDFQQPGAFHASITEVEAFVKSRLARRYEIIRSYMPYEFTVRVWKKTTLTEEGVYQRWS